jgi:protoporphyrinogen oxidase
MEQVTYKDNTAKRFIVIGAGPAGLTAAYKILQEIPNAQVDVYEVTERIGGISTTIEYHGNRIDIGGHRFFSKNKDVNDFWYSLMPLQGKGAKDDVMLGTKKVFASEGPDPEKTDTVMLIRNRVSRIFYRRRFFDYPISLKAQTFLNMGFGNSILAGMSFLYSSIKNKKRKEDSLENFYINRFGKKLYTMFFEKYTEKVWGIHPSKLSAVWGAQRVKELSITAIIKEALAKLFNHNYKTNQTSLIEQFYYPKMGPGQLWAIVADKIIEAGGCINYKQKVTGITIENGQVKSIKTQDNNETIFCDILLSTMPVKDLIVAVNTGGGEKAPEHITKNATELPYRDFITVGLLLKKLKLRNKTKAKHRNTLFPTAGFIYRNGM